jgi:hypothetical protein
MFEFYNSIYNSIYLYYIKYCDRRDGFQKNSSLSSDVMALKRDKKKLS